MMFDEILNMLKAETLNEEQKAALTEKLNDLVDIKVKEKLDEALETEKEKLLEHYEEKFEDYKKDITSKFSNFVDDILEEEMIIPENIMEYARKGELYSDLIDQFKVRIGIDEGVLDEEARELLSEARDEIVKLNDEINTLTEEKLVIESDAQDLASELYKTKKCEGLTTPERKRVLGLLEGVSNAKEIDRKFSLIVENKLHEAESKKYTCKCSNCGFESVQESKCTSGKCPECDEGTMDEAEEPQGKGQLVVEDKTEKTEEVNENKTPFQTYRSEMVKRWKEILKS